jgi:hypothetical protein
MKRQTFQVQAIFLLGFLLMSTLGVMGCSSAVQLTSDWKKSEIVIDGKQNEWQGSLYGLKKVNVAIGVRNDAENLYLCFISYDQGIGRQIMSGGFTVWFDPSGGTDERCGIKFPVGLPIGTRPMNMGNAGRSPQISGNNNDNSVDFPEDNENGDNTPPPFMSENMDTMSSRLNFGNNEGKMSTIPNNGQYEIHFLGPKEDDVQQATTFELKTVKVRFFMTRKAFVYELQVPLHKTGDFPFTLAPTDEKNIVGIGFKTENISFGGMGRPGGGQGGPPGGGQGGPPGGGQGGPPGGGQGGPPGGGSGGGRGMKGSNASEPIELWTKITLAHNDVVRIER